MESVSWPPAVLLLWSVVGGCGGGRFGIGFVKAEASSSGHSPWRIRCEFVESGALVGAPDLGGSSTVLPSSPSVSASVMLDSPAGSSGGKFYQLVESGWSSSPTFSGGFFSLRSVSSSGDLGPSTVVASDCRFSGDVMPVSHLVRPARSTSKMCVGVAGVLFWVPLKIFFFLRREDGRLQRDCSGRRRRAQPGEACKDLVVIFLFLKGVFVSVGM